jgi:hypothetical protein
MAVKRPRRDRSGHESSPLGHHHPLLTTGVTLSPKDDAELRGAWLTAVHAAMRAAKGLVIGELVRPTVGRNYYAIAVQHREQLRAGLLLNAPARLVTMVETDDLIGYYPTKYFPVPQPAIFRAHGFIPADVADLDQELVESDLAQLTKWERLDVKGHQSARVGQVLFNYYD